MKTGAIQAGIGRLVRKLKGRERWMIPLLMAVFAAGGTTYGMAEESLAFYALIITVMIAAGYDALTGAAVVLLGCGIGTLGSTINPFATGIASGFADTSISEGLDRPADHPDRRARHRHLLRAPLRGSCEERPFEVAGRRHEGRQRGPFQCRRADEGDEAAKLTGRHKLILMLFGLAFLVMMYGVIPWEDLGVGLPTLWWWFPEMTASFILFSILIGLVARMPEGELTETFVAGARDLLGVALIIGIARGITVIMNNGEITDTVLHWAEIALGDVGKAGVLDRDVRPVPAAVVPDPILVGARHGGDADHGAAGELLRRARAPRRDRLPERLGTHEPVHPDIGGRHGGPGDREGSVWHATCGSSGRY